MKRKVRLTESDLHRVIKESLKNILAENRVIKEDVQLQSYIDMVQHDEDFIFELNDIQMCLLNIKQTADNIVDGADVNSTTDHIKWLVNRLQQCIRQVLKIFGCHNLNI